jgi:23S rRNA U2552 (ribose-2'-O)-methylase RlmE/FtsJ
MSTAQLTSLADRYYPRGDAARKGDRLLRVYGRLLAEFQQQPIALLELGVYHGASMRIWREYFPRATIVGIDIEPIRLPDLPNVRIVQGDQAEPECLDRAIAAIGGSLFDIIIDDASHLGVKSKASFEHLFVHGLKPSGLYFVEDYAAPLLPGWPDGASFTRSPAGSLDSYQQGMIGFLKQVIDEMAIDVVRMESRFRLAEIAFYPNICVIRKAAAD